MKIWILIKRQKKKKIINYYIGKDNETGHNDSENYTKYKINLTTKSNNLFGRLPPQPRKSKSQFEKEIIYNLKILWEGEKKTEIDKKWKIFVTKRNKVKKEKVKDKGEEIKLEDDDFNLFEKIFDPIFDQIKENFKAEAKQKKPPPAKPPPAKPPLSEELIKTEITKLFKKPEIVKKFPGSQKEDVDDAITKNKKNIQKLLIIYALIRTSIMGDEELNSKQGENDSLFDTDPKKPDIFNLISRHRDEKNSDDPTGDTNSIIFYINKIAKIAKKKVKKLEDFFNNGIIKDKPRPIPPKRPDLTDVSDLPIFKKYLELQTERGYFEDHQKNSNEYIKKYDSLLKNFSKKLREKKMMVRAQKWNKNKLDEEDFNNFGFEDPEKYLSEEDKTSVANWTVPPKGGKRRKKKQTKKKRIKKKKQTKKKTR